MVQNFLMQLNQATSWSSPEILAIGKEKVMEYCKDYNVPFRNSCEGGVSSTVRYAEELLEEQTAIA